MKFEEILKFINIDSNFYNLLVEYKKNPKLHEKEVISTIIEKTKYTKEAIKILTSDYSNSSFLKEYIGKNDKEIFDRMKLAATDEKNNSGYFYKIYGEILQSDKVSNGLKTSIMSSIVALSNNSKYGKSVSEKEKEYGKNGKNEIIANIMHTNININDLNWINEIYTEVKPNQKLDIFTRIFNQVKKENIQELNIDNLKILRSFYTSIISYLKTYEKQKRTSRDEEYYYDSERDDESYQKEKIKKIENVKSLFSISDIKAGREYIKDLYKTGEWFVENMKDVTMDI